eukprot:SAG31_NODE_8968_length_1355_cov_1.694268_1_plen_111_part_00
MRPMSAVRQDSERLTFCVLLYCLLYFYNKKYNKQRTADIRVQASDSLHTVNHGALARRLAVGRKLSHLSNHSIILFSCVQRWTQENSIIEPALHTGKPYNRKLSYLSNHS